jgi:hypothetical protein
LETRKEMNHYEKNRYINKNNEYGYSEHYALLQQNKKKENRVLGVGDSEYVSKKNHYNQCDDPSGGHKLFCPIKK